MIAPKIINKIDYETIFNDLEKLLTDKTFLQHLNDSYVQFPSVSFFEHNTELSEFYVHYFDSPLWNTIDVKYKSTIIEFLDKYGKYTKQIIFSKKDFFIYPQSSINSIKKIVEQFNQDSDLLGFLRIISLLDTPKKEIAKTLAKVEFSLLEPEKYDDSKFKAAAIIVSLYRETWSDDDIDIIVDYAINLIEQHPRIIASILDLVEQKYFNQDICKKFLQQLEDKIPKSEWQQLNQIHKLMNEQLTTRISSLSNENKWTNLGFPKDENSLKILFKNRRSLKNNLMVTVDEVEQ